MRRRARRIVVDAYRSYGTRERVFVRGRVLADAGVGRTAPEDRWWRNLNRTWRRMGSREVPHARVAIRFQGSETEAIANSEGHVHTWIVPADPPPADRLWHDLAIEVVHPPPAGPGRGTTSVLVPSPAARFGVVSDIDDTVIQSDVARLLSMIADVAFGSAHTRAPFPGVAAFFRALHIGTGVAPNPVFYVSNGPWNLYDVFEHFLELRGIPPGPVELRDWGAPWKEVKRIGRYEHKLESIRRIFRTLPDLPLLLIGDSGEDDPEIYRDLVHEFPARVPAVYIRDVSRNPLRRREIAELAGEVDAAGSALVLAEDTLAAARHAAEHGWIEPAASAREPARRGRPSAGLSNVVRSLQGAGQVPAPLCNWSFQLEFPTRVTDEQRPSLDPCRGSIRHPDPARPARRGAPRTERRDSRRADRDGSGC